MTTAAPAASAARGVSRHAGTAALLLGLLAVILLAWATRGDTAPGEPLHPQNPDPEGARAVAQVLADEGVPVEVVAGRDELLAATLDPATTVVVTGTDLVGTAGVAALTEAGRRAGGMVLVAPGPWLLDQLMLPVAAEPSGPLRAEAECEDPRLAGLAVDLTTAVTYRSSVGDAAGCFPAAGGGAAVVGVDGTVLLGAPEVLANADVLRADHAAVALRLLGQRARVVWWPVSTDDLEVGDTTAGSGLTPDWLWPGVLLLALAVLAFAVSRGRRLGPLVVEPLPVTVRAAETAESRGRLYRRVRDQRHAAAALRAGARHRLAARLGLPAAAGRDPDTLVTALAAATGRDPGMLTALLADTVLTDGAGRPVTDDAALVRLAEELRRLEDELTGNKGGPR